MPKPTLVSLFFGAGGLDLGFQNAGFDTIWANEYDWLICNTIELNFPNMELDRRSIRDIEADEIPDSDGIIGGPPCQSWSEAGSGRGINDNRGRLFFDYIRILKHKQPKFFVVENVPGILAPRHRTAFSNFINEFRDAGYNVVYKLVNANDFGVPEDRKRVIIVGVRRDLEKTFTFPKEAINKPVLRDAIGDLPEAIPAKALNKANSDLKIKNHEYFTGGFSSIYMSRNRVRSWDEPSFTIQAGGRHAPIHPKAPKMQLVAKDKRVFVPGKEHLYRRLSVRECARIQTFPDDFIFDYEYVADGYKMVGNAVPVKLAEAVAKEIKRQI
ncbi:MAG: DNA cytosine methyltransferase [Bifidobacteriaceae bacterium]|jgi:DNA (cytosine-5)-methyltransferase 1|nr:DNA cytosine methyltransferase [Bifidobacteriaceae bacterium]